MLRTALILALTLFLSVAAAETPSNTWRARENVSVDFLYEACSNVGETARGKDPVLRLRVLRGRLSRLARCNSQEREGMLP